MMEKERTTRRSLLRALYLLPLVCISLALNAQTKVSYVYNDGKMSSAQLTYVGMSDTTTQVKKIEINGKIIYKKDEPADAGTTIPKLSVMDNGQDINMEFSGYTDEFVDGVIKSLPGVGYDEDGNMTIDGKRVSKILVNGQNYTSVRLDDQDNVNVNNVPNDAQVKDIIQKLPGAEIDAEGHVTINGKPIKKILVNGKELNDVTPDELKKFQSAQ